MRGSGASNAAMPLAATLEMVSQVPLAAGDPGVCTELARLCITANYPTLARDAIINMQSYGGSLSTLQYASLVEGAPHTCASAVVLPSLWLQAWCSGESSGHLTCPASTASAGCASAFSSLQV